MGYCITGEMTLMGERLGKQMSSFVNSNRLMLSITTRFSNVLIYRQDSDRRINGDSSLTYKTFLPCVAKCESESERERRGEEAIKKKKIIK